GGEPGIGKSTLMLQIAHSVKSNGRILYISGEESPGQIKVRADRLKISRASIEVLSETELSSIMNVLNNIKPVLVIVDSIQTLHAGEIDSAPGNVNQIKYCTQQLIEYIKERNIVLFLVAHVTKEGLIAGPKIAEHMVDTVLYFDQGEGGVRLLRSVKNRFGSVDEMGLFTMDKSGLEELKNPVDAFIMHRNLKNMKIPPGIATAIVYEGTRVYFVEIQSLLVPAKAGISRIFSDTIDSRRVSRIAAVLEKHVKLKLNSMDLYVAVAGGIRLNEVGIELPIALSIYSARINVPLPPGTASAGEVSLSGELRPVPHMDKRVKTGYDFGLDKIVIPFNPKLKIAEKYGNRLVSSYTLKESLRTVFSKTGSS
ncbi:MAG: DNA repair protein RadA, partial [Spirochaetales bacterium]|nr:DNA repair protein RadA [Spirochaetales bacterium]